MNKGHIMPNNTQLPAAAETTITETVHSLLQSTALCEMLQIDIAQDQEKANAQENARRYEVVDIIKQKTQYAIDALEQYRLQASQ